MDGAEVMNLFMQRIPSVAARNEGRPCGCFYIILWDPWRIRPEQPNYDLSRWTLMLLFDFEFGFPFVLDSSL